MVSDREKLLMSQEEFEATQAQEKIQRGLRKKELTIAIQTKKTNIRKFKKLRSRFGKNLGKLARGIRGRKRKQKIRRKILGAKKTIVMRKKIPRAMFFDRAKF